MCICLWKGKEVKPKLSQEQKDFCKTVKEAYRISGLKPIRNAYFLPEEHSGCVTAAFLMAETRVSIWKAYGGVLLWRQRHIAKAPNPEIEELVWNGILTGWDMKYRYYPALWHSEEYSRGVYLAQAAAECMGLPVLGR